MVSWPLKTQLQHHISGNTLQGWDKVLQKAVYALNQCLIFDTVSPTARTHGYRNQGVELEVAPLTITPSAQLAKFLHLISSTVHPVGLEVLVPKGGMLLPGDTQGFC